MKSVGSPKHASARPCADAWNAKNEMRPLIPRVLSCQRHGWPSISTQRHRWALAAYPMARASSPCRHLFGLAPDEACHAAHCHQRPGGLLHHRFTLTHRPKPIRRSVLCCAISQVTLGGRYPPSCSMEPGSSSDGHANTSDRGHQEVSNAQLYQLLRI